MGGRLRDWHSLKSSPAVNFQGRNMLIVYALLTLLSTPTVPAPCVDANVELTVEEVVTKWVEASRTSGQRQGSFRIYEYDTELLTEKRGVGRFFIESPHRWRVDFQPAGNIQEDQIHLIKGEQYTLEPVVASHVILTENSLYDFPQTAKPAPKITFKNLFSNLISYRARHLLSIGPLTMFPHRNENLFNSHEIQFGDKNESGIHLIFTPAEKLYVGYVKFEVLLNKETHLPKAVKVHGPESNSKTVYVFHRLLAGCTIGRVIYPPFGVHPTMQIPDAYRESNSAGQ